MKSKDIIATRKRLDNDINKYWKILKTENIVPKGQFRNYEMKKLIEAIQKLSEERTRIKLYLQCINMGLKKFSELSDSNNYKTIYELGEKREQLIQLGYIKTIDPKIKRAKGKKGLKITEELTSTYIKSLKDKLQLEINELEKKIEEFNDETEFDITDTKPMLALVA